MKIRNDRGESAFDNYFLSVYGDRWLSIKESLATNDKKIARSNLFFEDKSFNPLNFPGIIEPNFQLNSIWGGTKNINSFDINQDFDLSQASTSILPFYRMDPASLFPAKALAVENGQTVIDLCAAPGGKSLILIEDLFRCDLGYDLEGVFIANELSPKRRHRMMTVFKRYLPHEIRKKIFIKSLDASRVGLERKEFYDRILLDAPCSGERGLLHKKEDLAQWKEKRTKSFAIRQYSLLSSAFMALKPGGRIVYSTCSISPHENDGVIAKLHKRRKNEFEVLEGISGFGEKTEFGTLFLPDQGGWGPIFYSVIQKNKKTK